MRALITREGDYWTVDAGGGPVRVRDSKGMRYLATLFDRPETELHVLDLVSAVEGAQPPEAGRVDADLEARPDLGDAGEALDPEAKEAYKRRYAELQEELEEAQSWSDPERVAAAKEELDFIAAELAAAVGLGGRDRKSASAAERARVNVTRAIKSALKKIGEHDAELGRSLEVTIKTGTFCSYRPAPGVEVALGERGEAPPAEEPGGPAEAPAGPPPGVWLVGRDSELGQLTSALAEAGARRGSLYLIAGEPGVGKTRLADALATHARHQGALVLWGRCWEGGGAPAFWPWVQVLREYVADTGVNGLAERVGPAAGLLGQLLPELGTAPAAESGSLETEQARFALFDAIAGVLRQAGRDRAIVVVLDDLHAADESSLLLLDFLARELGGSGILVLGNYRAGEGDEKTLALIGRLAPHARAFELTGLGEEAAGALVEAQTGSSPPPALVTALRDTTDGNPFFMEEVLRLLVAQGLLDQPDHLPEKLPVPEGVREAVRRRLEPLPDEAARLLQLAAVLGKEFTLPSLERASELTPTRVLELLDESVHRGLVSPVPEALGRFRFGHALIREVLYDSLSATARIELHQRVGEGLEVAYADDPDPHLAELAHHFLQAAPAGDVDKAVDYAARAGERAMSLLAFEEAARSYERALQALDLRETADRERRCDLLLALGAARSSAGDAEGAKDAFNRASELARRLRDPEREGQAALGYAGRYWTTGVVDSAAVSLLERAISALGDTRGLLKAEMLGRLATQLYYSEDPERLDALSGEAVQIARAVGEPGPLASVLAARIAAVWGPDNLDERSTMADEIVELAAGAGEREVEMRGRCYRVSCLLERGDAQAADVEVETASRIAEELRHPLLLWHTRGLRGVRALMSGRYEEAERLSVEAFEAGRRADEENARQYRGIHLTQLGYDRGELEEVEQMMRRFVEGYAHLRTWRCTLALLLSELGREADARREFELAGAADWQDARKDGTWLTGMGRAVEACARLRDTARAPRLYELMAPYAGRVIVLGRIVSNCVGAAERPLGMLAAVMGRHEESDAHFKRAIELNRRMGAEPWVARARVNWAEALIARGDTARAGELLDEACATAETLPMPLLMKQAALVRKAA